MDFNGKVALIAGGTGGLGVAISLAFLRAGAHVAVTYRTPAEFSALQSLAPDLSPRLEGHRVDVTDEDGVRKLVKELVQKHERVDLLVNAVGGYSGGTKFWEIDPDTFDQMLNLNLRSGFVLARAVVPVMLKQQVGSIVNIASKAALDHAAGAAAYAASKSAAVAMIDCLAEDLRGSGVRANSVLPSIIDTPANRKAMPNADFTKWPKAEEIARVILFLCSDDARLIHGATIPVYGAY